MYNERDIQDMVEAFRKAMRENNLPVCDCFKIAATLPAPRFYTSPMQAYRIVSRMHRGLPVRIENELKKEMYREIYRRWVESGSTTYATLKDIIEQPAPRFYIAESTFTTVVYRELRKNSKKKYDKTGS